MFAFSNKKLERRVNRLSEQNAKYRARIAELEAQIKNFHTDLDALEAYKHEKEEELLAIRRAKDEYVALRDEVMKEAQMARAIRQEYDKARKRR